MARAQQCQSGSDRARRWRVFALKIAQRFNAGSIDDLRKTSPGSETDSVLSSLMGLDGFIVARSSVKTLGYCQVTD